MNLEHKAETQARSSLAELTYTVDSFANGIAFGQHAPDPAEDPRALYHLRLEEDAEVIRLRSRYTLHRARPLYELERNLMRLSTRGLLRSAEIYFGTTTDPFHPFKAKFDASIKFLDLFRRYQPGLLHVQSRSPLLVLALPSLRALGKHVSVTIGLETPLPEIAAQYMPELPRIDERLKLANTLRHFGIEVVLQAAPLLPYGDWKQAARAFAKVLADHADYIYVQPLISELGSAEKKQSKTPVYKKLAAERRFHWLRPDAAKPLLQALAEIAPEKLTPPKREFKLKSQLEIFAA